MLTNLERYKLSEYSFLFKRIVEAMVHEISPADAECLALIQRVEIFAQLKVQPICTEAEELQKTFGSKDCPKSSSVAIALTKPIIASRPFQSSPAAMSSLLYGG